MSNWRRAFLKRIHLALSEAGLDVTDDHLFQLCAQLAWRVRAEGVEGGDDE